MRQNKYEYSYELKLERKHRNTRIFFIILSVILFLSIFLSFILFPVRVSSDTMEGDVTKGGAVFVTPLDRSPKRGDVVLLARADGEKPSGIVKLGDLLLKFFTAQQLSTSSTNRITGKPCLRRVLALPGDYLYMKDYVLYVKPAGQKQYLTEFELATRPYTVHIYSVPVGWDGLGSNGTLKERKLGKNEYFVLADNRIEGTDSRVWGTIPGSRIMGKALLQYFPFNRIKIY